MPKQRQRVRTWNLEGGVRRKERYYYERFDRVNIQRVYFSPGSNCIGVHRNRNLDRAVRAYIDEDDDDDDVDMSTPGSSGSCGRFNPRSWRSQNQAGGSGGGRRRPGQSSPAECRSKFLDTSTFFYKVTIPHGGKYSKEYIL